MAKARTTFSAYFAGSRRVMLIKVNDISLFVSIKGEGEPLLLLHGFTGSHKSWSNYVDQWSKQYRVIAVDIIGHGFSECPLDPRRYSMEHAVQDITALLDKLQLSKVHIVGYSMGGRIALSYAILQSARVNKLIIESGSPGLESSEQAKQRVIADEALARKIEQEGIQEFINYWENIPLFHSLRQCSEQVQQSIREQRLYNDPLGLANSLRGMGTGAQPSWWDKLDQLHIATLLICGEQDEKFVAIATRMNKLLPNSSYAEVSNSGHLVHVEQPLIFDKIVREFLAT